MIRETYEIARDVLGCTLFVLTMLVVAFVAIGYHEGVLQ